MQMYTIIIVEHHVQVSLQYTTQQAKQRPGMKDMSLCAGYSANVYVSPAG